VPRFALIKQPEHDAALVPETALPAEADLHAALTEHPELIPAEDLGLGRVAVVGSESGLASGYADLVMVDELGAVCLVEVKNEGNPDTRRVVAQLIDYAAALWGADLEEFERTVARPFLTRSAHDSSLSLRDHLQERFGAEDPSGVDDSAPVDPLAGLFERLGANLQSGRFTLVVAAPSIPPGTRRAVDYLNAQGCRIFGVEVSYFSGPAECFVPRVVVQPAPSSGPSTSGHTETLDRETFLARLASSARSFVADLLDASVDVGAEIRWNTRGPSLYVTRGTETRAVAYLTTKLVGCNLIATGSFPSTPYLEAKSRLEAVGLGSTTPAGVEHSIPLEKLSTDSQTQIHEIVVALCQNLSDQVIFEPVDPPEAVQITRNDFNVWAAKVSSLQPYEGRYLRGTLRRGGDTEDRAVTLAPTTGGAAAWVPRFSDQTVRDAIWPPGESGDDYLLTIHQLSSARRGRS